MKISVNSSSDEGKKQFGFISNLMAPLNVLLLFGFMLLMAIAISRADETKYNAPISIPILVIPFIISWLLTRLDSLITGEDFSTSWKKFTNKFGRFWLTIALSILTLSAYVGHQYVSNACSYMKRAPADVSKRELLVLIAKFGNATNSSEDPSGQWELVLKKAKTEIDQLQVGSKKPFSLSFLQIPQTIRVDKSEEALVISDCYQASMVIWGTVGDGVVDSYYTPSARWSKGHGLGSDYVVMSDPLKFKDFLRDGGDSEYALNYFITALLANERQDVQAIPFIKKALDLAPKDRLLALKAYALYGQLAYGLSVEGKYSDAQATINDAAKLFPNNVDLAGVQGSIYLAQRKYALAIAQYSIAINGAQKEDRYGWYYDRALANLSLEQYDDSFADCQDAIAIDARDAGIYVIRGQIFRYRKDLNAALSDFMKAAVLDPNYSDAYRWKGVVLSEMGNDQQAIPMFARAIELSPSDAESAQIYDSRARSWVKLGDSNQAVLDYSAVIRIFPQSSDFVDAYVNRGNLYSKHGDHANAKADFKKAIDIAPHWNVGYSSLAGEDMNQGLYEEAIANFNSAIKIQQTAEDLRDRGICYDKLGQKTEALRDYTLAIALDPNFVEGYYTRGVFYLDSQAYQKAITDFTSAIHLQPAYDGVYIGRALAYDHLNMYAEALDDYQKALKQHPDDALIMSSIARMKNGLQKP